jgi:Trk K+ transport system NAD-binding subunit
MTKASLPQRLRYRFDNFISKGGMSIFFSLVVAFIAILVVIGGLRAAVFWFFPDGAAPFDGMLLNIFITFVQLADPGNMAQDIPTTATYKITGILAGLSGVILLSMLIAVVTTALDQKLHELKQGHSKVLESDHSLILGWNERVVEIVRELILANESERNPAIVILSELEKEEMDETLRTRVPDTANTRVITRSGNTSLLANLDRVTVEGCKSIIVLASCADSAPAADKEASDAMVIKTVLAVIATRHEGKRHNIVAEIFDARNRRIVEQLAPDEVRAVDTEDILAKILVQTSRTSGLAVVYNEILSFDGSEMYFHGADWGGARFSDLQYHFADGVPMGIRRPDGAIMVNPEPETPMQDGDEILILAQDDSTIRLKRKPVTTPAEHRLREGRLAPKKERNLILGWNRKAAVFAHELADYVRDESRIDIVVDNPSDDIKQEVQALKRELGKLSVKLFNAKPLSREVLVALKPFTYDNVVILSQGAESGDSERTDSETIIILLLLRSIFEANPEESGRTALITEVMDSDNQELISKAGVNDFIVSNRLVSNMLAQISEEPDMKAVYDNLFEESGSEIYLKPAALYFESLPLEVSFADLLAVANKRREICIGVREAARAADIDANFGVRLVPAKTTRYRLTADDALVVVAEDEL